MIYWVGITDGDFNSGYTCLTCENIIEIKVKLKELEYGRAVDFGYVSDMTSKEITPEIILEHLKTKQNE